MGILARLFKPGTAKAERLATIANNRAEREAAEKLHEAIKNGDLNLVKTTLTEAVSADAQSSDVWKTALHAAAFYDNVDAAELLISSKPDIEIDIGLYGESPLQRAAYAGAAIMVEWLLSRGANVNYVDRDWRTPLHYLFKGPREETYFAVFRWDKKRWAADAPLAFAVLLKNGADLNARTRSGQTPQDIAGPVLFPELQRASTKVLGSVLTKGVRGLKDPSYFECPQCRNKLSHLRAKDKRIGDVWVCPSCEHQQVRLMGA